MRGKILRQRIEQRLVRRRVRHPEIVNRLDESPPDGKTSSKLGVVPSGDSQCFIPVTPKRDATDENP